MVKKLPGSKVEIKRGDQNNILVPKKKKGAGPLKRGGRGKRTQKQKSWVQHLPAKRRKSRKKAWGARSNRRSNGSQGKETRQRNLRKKIGNKTSKEELFTITCNDKKKSGHGGRRGLRKKAGETQNRGNHPRLIQQKKGGQVGYLMDRGVTP